MNIVRPPHALIPVTVKLGDAPTEDSLHNQLPDSIVLSNFSDLLLKNVREEVLTNWNDKQDTRCNTNKVSVYDEDVQ